MDSNYILGLLHWFIFFFSVLNFLDIENQQKTREV